MKSEQPVKCKHRTISDNSSGNIIPEKNVARRAMHTHEEISYK